MKERKKNVRFTLVLLAVLIVASVVVTITSSSKGSELLALEREIEIAERENKELKAQVVAATSLTRLSGKAENLEMNEPGQVVYLSPQRPFAWK